MDAVWEDVRLHAPGNYGLWTPLLYQAKQNKASLYRLRFPPVILLSVSGSQVL